jgi:hypothetical protein
MDNNYSSSNEVLYQDNDVCILNPKFKKGVIVWTNFTQPEGMESLCTAGLKTGKQLHSEGIDLGRSVAHPYIFFRAPYYNNPINYSTVESEINSLYGELPNPAPGNGRAFIRVDPENTYVYSSEIREEYRPKLLYGTPEYFESIEREVQKSRKSLSEYLKIIKENESVVSEATIPVYHLYSSTKLPFDIKHPNYPKNIRPINRNSEILVGKPHLESHYFVKCE